jgi:intracellular septation protein A
MSIAAIKDRLTRVWTYRWSVTLDGLRYDVRLECRWHCNTFVVASHGETLACEVLNFYSEPFRLQELVVERPSGSRIAFRTGPATMLVYGLEVVADGSVAYRSRPDPFATLAMMQNMLNFVEKLGDGARQADDRAIARNRRNVFPAIAADIGVGLLLYFAAGYMSLRDTAILGAAVVLLLMLVDWVTERLLRRDLNLSGGLSSFGVIMLLSSAAFAWLVENELAIMLKSSVLGLLAAGMLAIDAMLGGRYIGKRAVALIGIANLDPRRFSWGSAMAAGAKSLLGATIAIWLSRDAWLLYRHWIGPTLAIALSIVVLWKARQQRAPL